MSSPLHRHLHLYRERHGEGPPLLFLNGTGGDLRVKPNVFDGPLVRHFDVLAHDQRGLGRSDKPDVAYSMADYADDAAGLLDEVSWERAHVLGVSFGGMVAQELAIRHPDRVDRLVLCCTSPGGAGGASYPLHELAGLPVEERMRRSVGLADVRNGEAWQRDHPEQLEAVLALLREREAVGADDPARAVGARRQLEARAAHDTWERLGAVTAPTLVCAGRHDAIAPPANAEALAGRIPDARLEVFDGGHLFLVQDRRAFPTIVDFLEEPVTPGGPPPGG